MENRIPVPLSEVNEYLIKAVLATEDANFYHHKGIYWPRVFQAAWKNLKAGGYVQGASTITQQLARSIFLFPQKTISRKVKEIFLAYKIEKNYPKDKILELYLNQIYFGNGAYGIEAAAKSYFGKKAINLEIAEAAMLAGLILAPNRYSPCRNPDLAQQRCSVVLRRMLDEECINQQQHKAAWQFSFQFQKKEKEKMKAPYFIEYIRQYLQQKYKRSFLYNGGLTVQTTLDLNLQKIDRNSLHWGLEQLDKRQGFRPLTAGLELLDDDVLKKEIMRGIQEKKPLKKKMLGVVKEVFHKKIIVDVLGINGEITLQDMQWTNVKHPGEILQAGDKILVQIRGYKKKEGAKQSSLILSLEQEPLVQGAMVVLDAKTGYIRAMVGGYNFCKSKFNRAVQAYRQPGSSFKPFIYTQALLQGKTLADIIIDSPIIYQDETQEKDWKPTNYQGKFNGPTTLRKALEHSKNVVTVKLLQEVGVDNVIHLIRKMGITSPLSPDLSLALGASGLSLLEITAAYGVFANQGFYTKPVAIEKVLDDQGTIIEKNIPSPQQVLDIQTNYLMTSLLEGVIQHGTGWRAKALKRPLAGKTGTTNKYIDTWFIGFSPELVVGVWVGFDEYRSLGENETGSRAACPIWVKFMDEALKGSPAINFAVPGGITYVTIDQDTGLIATENCENVILEVFREGTEPKEKCNCRQLKADRFFDIDFQSQKK